MSSVVKKLVSGSLLRVGNLIANLAVAFFLTPFVIHALGDRTYGLWVLVGTFFGYYGLLDLGLSNAIGRYISKAVGADDQKTINEVYNTGFSLFLLVGLAALGVTLAAMVLAPMLWGNLQEMDEIRLVLLFLGLNTAIDLPIRVYHGLLSARLRFDLLAYIGLFTLLLRTLLIVLAVKGGYGLIGLAVASMVANVPGHFLHVIYAYKHNPGLKFDVRQATRATVKMLFTYSFFVFILQVSRQLIFHADAFVLTALMSLTAVAHYNIASMLLQHFDMLMGRLMGVLTPYFSQLDGANDNAQVKQTLFFTTKISVVVSSFIGFGFMVWGYDFIQRWMGPDYLDAYPCLVALIAGMLFSLWQNPSIALLYGTSKHRFLAVITIVEGIVNLGLSILLVPRFGILGAALGTAIPLFLHKAFIQPVYVCRVSFLKLSEYLGTLVQGVCGAGVALILPYFLARSFSQPDYLTLVYLAVSSFVLYLPVVWFLVFRRLERDRLVQLVGGRFLRRSSADSSS